MWKLESLKVYSLIIGLLILSSCGAHTSPFILQPNTELSQSQKAQLRVESVKAAKNCGQSIKGYWNLFFDHDIYVIDKSLKSTIDNTQKNITNELPEYKIYVFVFRYTSIVTMQDEVCTLADVAWCLENNGNEIIYSEHFYTSSDIHKGYLKVCKDRINKTIVKRIANKSFSFVADNKSVIADETDNIYNTLQEAISDLTKTTIVGGGVAMAPTGFKFSDGTTVKTTAVNRSLLDWDEIPVSTIEWKSYIQEIKKQKK